MKNPMTIQKGDFGKKLLTLVLPIAFQQFMLATVSASDAIMLGMIDQDSLSAVSLAGQVQFVFNLFLAAMTIGTSIFAAQYWGKGDKEAVEKVLAIALRISSVVSVVFFAAAVFFPAFLMRIFTPDVQLIASGIRYLRVVGISYVLCGVSQIYLCIMKNSGRAGKSTVISSVAVVLNIILNAVFIFGLWGAPEMGIAGAALATVISRIVELLWALLDSVKPGRIKVRGAFIIHTDVHLKRDFWKYTLPVLGNELVWGCGFTMYSVIMGHLGTDAVAANSIANIVKNLIACFCLGLGSGGGIIVGNELGAGRPARGRSLRTEIMPAVHYRRCDFRVSASGVKSADSGHFKSQSTGGFLFEMDACHVLLLHNRKGRQWYDDCRDILCRRRFKIWLFMRYGDAVVHYRAPGAHCSLCAQAAGAGCIFYR